MRNMHWPALGMFAHELRQHETLQAQNHTKSRAPVAAIVAAAHIESRTG